MEKKMLKRSLAVWMVLVLLFISVAPVAMMEGEEASTPEAQETVSVDNNINEEADELLDENAEMLDNVTSAPATVEEPAAEEAPVAEEPAVEEPAVEEPAVEEPAAEEAPAVEEPAVEEPAAEEPAAEEAPVAEEPAVEEPAVEEPAAEEPAAEEAPVAEEPAAEEAPVAEEPAVEEPAVEEPAVEEPAVEEPVAEEPSAAEEPAAEETPVVEEPVAEEPSAAEEPAAEETPVVEEPVAEEPSAEEPAVEEPATEEPVVEEVDHVYFDYAAILYSEPSVNSDWLITIPGPSEHVVLDYPADNWAQIEYYDAETETLLNGYVYCLEEAPVIPDDAEHIATLEDALAPDCSIDIYVSWGDQEAAIGNTATLYASLNGYDNVIYYIQWQTSKDGSNWADIDGAMGYTLPVTVTMDNYMDYWRVVVTVTAVKE
ncbi:MAG: hypothetical protein IKM26_07720 [Clostridia bacterium]|nr:hypothetical protein [Clostridia bacterium]